MRVESSTTQSFRALYSTGATLKLGAGGVFIQGPTAGLQLSSDVLVTADQTWDIRPITQFVPGLHLYRIGADPEPVLDLGGHRVEKIGAEELWITGGYDVKNGTLVTKQSRTMIFSGSTSGPVDLASSLTLRAESGGIISLTCLGMALTSASTLELDNATLNLGGDTLGLQSTSVGGSLSVAGNCKLTFDNTSISTASAVNLILNAPITGTGELWVEASSPRPYADRLWLRGNNIAFAGRIKVEAAGGNRTLRLASLSGSNPGSALAAWEVGAGNKIEIHGTSVAFGTLEGSGVVTNSHTTNPVTLRAGGGTFSGTITQNTVSLSLIKDTSATLHLTQAPAWSGHTTVEGGVLILDLPGLPNTGTLNLTSGTELSLAFGGTDAVASLTIDGVLQAAGTWGAPGSGAAHTTPLISGPGILYATSGSSSDPYTTWVGSFAGITDPAQRTPWSDPDQDGLNNLAEFALNGNPASSVSSGKVAGRAAIVGGLRVWTLTVPMRDGIIADPADPAGGELVFLQSADGLRYRVRAAADLADWTLAVSEVTGTDATAAQAGLPALDSGWHYHTFRGPRTMAASEHAFLTLRIESTTP